MAADSTLDLDNVPGTPTLVERKGNDTGSLGPSDSSDSGSDIANTPDGSPVDLASDSDAEGTGDRAGVGGHDEGGSDIGIDRIIGPEDAGLGTGLDEAELARKGK